MKPREIAPNSRAAFYPERDGLATIYGCSPLDPTVRDFGLTPEGSALALKLMKESNRPRADPRAYPKTEGTLDP